MPYKDKKEQKKAQREHYLKYKASYLRRTKERRQRIMDVIIPLKEKPCTDCGKKYPFYVMDFDHREGEHKVSDINRMTRNSGRIKEILAEIKKCDLVCANCHRARTYKRSVESCAPRW